MPIGSSKKYSDKITGSVFRDKKSKPLELAFLFFIVIDVWRKTLCNPPTCPSTIGAYPNDKGIFRCTHSIRYTLRFYASFHSIRRLRIAGKVLFGARISFLPLAGYRFLRHKASNIRKICKRSRRALPDPFLPVFSFRRRMRADFSIRIKIGPALLPFEFPKSAPHDRIATGKQSRFHVGDQSSAKSLHGDKAHVLFFAH